MLRKMLLGQKVEVFVSYEFFHFSLPSQNTHMAADYDTHMAADYGSVIRAFTSIRGMTKSKAEIAYKNGVRTITQLAKSNLVNPCGSGTLVNESIRLQAKYFDEMHVVISVEMAKNTAGRIEIALIEHCMQLPDSPLASVQDVFLAGSHRRGKSSMHDIDVLIVCTDTAFLTADMEELLMHQSDYLGTLSRGESRYSFVWRVGKSAVTIIDLVFSSAEEGGAALLYLTGSAEFNVATRRRAAHLGYLLSEHGLFLRDGTNELVHATSESELFRLLGLPFIEPSERDKPEMISLVLGGI